MIEDYDLVKPGLNAFMGFFSAFRSCLDSIRPARTAGSTAPDDGDEGLESFDLFFELNSLQIATNFFSELNKLGHGGFGPVYKTWMLYQGGKALDILDPNLTKCNRDEAAMCIQLGLLCCQATVADRPDMNAVHLMLSSDSFTLPRPTKPGIQGRVGRWTTASSSAFTNTNPSSGYTGGTRASASGSIIVEECSRNSMSVSSIDEGR
ncbi:hypothetical protein F8388_019842 [Cannabis sativa]|uniref:Uncharacterized protein n=1 Tax=Cannabis sativa TaxID=3483 RepID=A0A7J6HM05_CANSA|nr:hypothetical protein F8388_019842 [Cannabis sativa]